MKILTIEESLQGSDSVVSPLFLRCKSAIVSQNERMFHGGRAEDIMNTLGTKKQHLILGIEYFSVILHQKKL